MYVKKIVTIALVSLSLAPVLQAQTKSNESDIQIYENGHLVKSYAINSNTPAKIDLAASRKGHPLQETIKIEGNAPGERGHEVIHFTDEKGSMVDAHLFNEIVKDQQTEQALMRQYFGRMQSMMHSEMQMLQNENRYLQPQKHYAFFNFSNKDQNVMPAEVVRQHEQNNALQIRVQIKHPQKESWWHRIKSYF
mgnify:CR=1 FL=1